MSMDRTGFQRLQAAAMLFHHGPWPISRRFCHAIGYATPMVPPKPGNRKAKVLEIGNIVSCLTSPDAFADEGLVLRKGDQVPPDWLHMMMNTTEEEVYLNFSPRWQLWNLHWGSRPFVSNRATMAEFFGLGEWDAGRYFECYGYPESIARKRELVADLLNRAVIFYRHQVHSK